jgi:hypothetical protein
MFTEDDKPLAGDLIKILNQGGQDVDEALQKMADEKVPKKAWHMRTYHREVVDEEEIKQ